MPARPPRSGAEAIAKTGMDNLIGDATPGAHRLILRRDLDEIGRMAAWIDDIARRAELPEALVFGLQLCLEEAISNVIRHGAAAAERSEIVVSLDATDHAVAAAIEDEGMPFDPTLQPPPEAVTSIESAKVGGLGIQLMRQFTTRIDYCREGSRNKLVLTFARA
jgi:serine/threonine-protein kinase RsbW